MLRTQSRGIGRLVFTPGQRDRRRSLSPRLLARAIWSCRGRGLSVAVADTSHIRGLPRDHRRIIDLGQASRAFLPDLHTPAVAQLVS